MGYVYISVGLDDHPITTDDHAYTSEYDHSEQRVVQLVVGPVTLMCGSTEQARIEALDRLIVAATTLRVAAGARLAAIAQ